MGLNPTATQPQTRLGDKYFLGVNMRYDPTLVQEGYASSAKNARFNRGVAETRLGTMVFPWTNNISTTGVAAWGTIYGTGWFNDPQTFQDYLIIAADGNVYVCFQDNYPQAMTLPSGVTITEQVTFTQAFNTLIMHRGFDAAALKCDGPDQPWEFIGQSDQYLPGSTVTETPAYVEFVISEPQGITIRPTGAPYGPWMVVDGVQVSGLQLTFSGETRTVNNLGAGVPADVSYGGTMTARFTPPTPWEPGSRHTARLNWQTYRGDWSNRTSGGVYVGPFTIAQQTQVQTVQSVTTTGPSQFVAGTAEIPRVKRSIFHQNRLFLPNKDDSIAISDFNDYTRYQPILQTFRINQGSSDRLVRIVKWNDTTIIAFKEHSIYAINNVFGDLSSATLDLITDQFGLVSADSVAHCGNDLLFLSGFGVMSLQQTEQNKIQCVVEPLSDPIQPLIDRINWKFAPDAVGAYWENRYYLAVPLDESEQLGSEMVKWQMAYSSIPDTLTVTVVSGATYRWQPTEFETSLTNGTEVLTYGGDFVAQSTSVTITGNSDVFLTCSLKRVYKGINNAILVYDFLNKAWAGYDQEDGLIVKKMFLFPMDNRNRLFISTHEGYVKLYEEDYEDQLSVPYATLTVNSAPANLTTVAVNGGTTVTASTAASVNSGTTWGVDTAAHAKANIAFISDPAIRSYAPICDSPWLATNAIAFKMGDSLSETNTNGVVRFYAKNGIVPRILTNIHSSLVTITRSGNTATLTLGGGQHNAAVGDIIVVSGAAQAAYNGWQVVTSIPGVQSLTYTVYGEPATPATGSITFGIEFTSTSATWGTVIAEQHQPIHFELLTRGYTDPSGDLSSFPWLSVDMQTWNPTYSVSVVQPGAEEEFDLITDRTKDRTQWYRPFDKSAFVLTNADGRFMDKWRQDYSIEFGSDTGQTTGIDTHTTTDGIRCDLHQDSRETIHLMRSARSAQVKITNTTGRIRVMSVLFDTHKRATEGYVSA